jgi:hypothetical protein
MQMGNSNASMAPLSAKKSARTVISQSKTPKNILLYLSSNIRLHSAIYYLTPEDVLLGRVEKRLEERQQKLNAARQRRRQAQNELIAA